MVGSSQFHVEQKEKLVETIQDNPSVEFFCFSVVANSVEFFCFSDVANFAGFPSLFLVSAYCDAVALGEFKNEAPQISIVWLSQNMHSAKAQKKNDS